MLHSIRSVCRVFLGTFGGLWELADEPDTVFEAFNEVESFRGWQDRMESWREAEARR